MPWCPKCRLEYREGVQVCADCGSELTDELELKADIVELARVIKKESADKLTGFLDYSGIRSAESIYDKTERVYIISVEEKDIKQARKLYEAFYVSEKEKKALESEPVCEDEGASMEDEALKKEADEYELLEETRKLRSMAASTYVKKEVQFNDLKSSAYMFIIFGILGIVLVILNVLNVISILSGALTYVVMTAMCVAFLFIGITSYIKSGKVKKQIHEEENLTSTLNKWLEENITEESLAKMRDPNVSEEIEFLAIMQYIKEQVEEQFGELDESYLDQIAEEFYDRKFG